MNIRKMPTRKTPVPVRHIKDYIADVEESKKKIDKKYEDYVAIKQKEHAELQELVDLMETPEITYKRYDGDELYNTDEDSFFNEIAGTSSTPPPSSNFVVQEDAQVIKAKMAEKAAEVEKQEIQGLKAYQNGAPVKTGPVTVTTSKPFTNRICKGNGNWEEIATTSPDFPTNKYTTEVKKYKSPIQQPRRSAAQFINPSVRIADEYESAMPKVDSETTRSPADMEMFDRVRDNFKIVRSSERTLVYVVVKSKDATKNIAGQIKCCGGIALGGYARDAANDAFLVECVTYIHLGTIPFGFKLEMPNCGTWSVDVPIPERVIEKALRPMQRKALSDLLEKYPTDTHEIFYLQLILAT